MAQDPKYCMFPFPDHEGGEFQFSKDIKMKAGGTDRWGGGARKNVFHGELE